MPKIESTLIWVSTKCSFILYILNKCLYNNILLFFIVPHSKKYSKNWFNHLSIVSDNYPGDRLYIRYSCYPGDNISEILSKGAKINPQMAIGFLPLNNVKEPIHDVPSQNISFQHCILVVLIQKWTSAKYSRDLVHSRVFTRIIHFLKSIKLFDCFLKISTKFSIFNFRH